MVMHKNLIVDTKDAKVDDVELLYVGRLGCRESVQFVRPKGVIWFYKAKAISSQYSNWKLFWGSVKWLVEEWWHCLVFTQLCLLLPIVAVFISFSASVSGFGFDGHGGDIALCFLVR